MPGNVFAHIILARIKPTLLSQRHPQQSGFMPGHSTCDRIATLCNIAQWRQAIGHPTFAAFADIRAAFDSLTDPCCDYSWQVLVSRIRLWDCLEWKNSRLCCIQVFSVVNCTSRKVWKTKPWRTAGRSLRRPSSIVRTRRRRSVCDGLDIRRRRRREVKPPEHNPPWS